MKLLLDVNPLIAAICGNHTENGRVLAWIASLKTREFITCPIVELGFVRITVATRLQPGIPEARDALERWKKAAQARFVADDIPASGLPDWVASAGKTTDAHLWALAQSLGAEFATMDEGLMDRALCIPRLPPRSRAKSEA